VIAIRFFADRVAAAPQQRNTSRARMFPLALQVFFFENRLSDCGHIRHEGSQRYVQLRAIEDYF